MNIFKFFSKKIQKHKDIFSDGLEKVLGKYVTYHLRPKFYSDINITPDTLKTCPKVAIIIQGPLLQKDKFTLNTVRLYKKIFKDYRLILSTWEAEDADCIRELRNENIEVILNKKPAYPGIANINFQIASTFSAVKRAEEQGVDYILKTRTDTRLYNQNSIEFLVNLLRVFPSNAGPTQNGRIAFPSLNTFKYRPYSVTDLVMFGTTSEMIKYWTVDMSEQKQLPTSNLVGDWSKARLAEAYLSTSYLEKLGRDLKWTITDSWKVYADHFCVFDSQSIDLYWHKYARTREYRRLAYNHMKNDQELTFAEWLNIFAHFENKKTIPEYILQTNFAEQIKGEI